MSSFEIYLFLFSQGVAYLGLAVGIPLYAYMCWYDRQQRHR